LGSAVESAPRVVHTHTHTHTRKHTHAFGSELTFVNFHPWAQVRWLCLRYTTRRPDPAGGGGLCVVAGGEGSGAGVPGRAIGWGGSANGWRYHEGKEFVTSH